MTDFFLPCDEPKIISRQGWRQLPGEEYRWHNGVDFIPAHRAAEGSPLYAVGAGIIRASVESGTPGFRGYGRTVLLELGPSVFALYGHNASNLVREGDRVVGGQAIATMGRTSGRGGDPSAMIAVPHVHFEFARRWPLAAADTFDRYDVLATFATAGIVEISGRLVRQEGPAPYIIPSGLARTTPGAPYQHRIEEPGIGGFVELGALALVVRAINEGRD